jgi:hypothetical protein
VDQSIPPDEVGSPLLKYREAEVFHFREPENGKVIYYLVSLAIPDKF